MISKTLEGPLEKELGLFHPVRVKEGWEEAGRKGTVLGEQIFLGQWWCPILWEDEEDPDFHKSTGLEIDV